ncbi:response regulator [Serratia sp. L9]|uniref:response regulator n=1 Tax=Serratia sp. L9 TaxID=3423946 RepID=UPI003D675386
MGESLKWTVDVANSGSEALQLMQQQRDKGVIYGALFIDWRMPGLDGWQTSKLVRELMPEGKAPMIVMITAHDREMLLQRSEEDQALLDGYLVKPITASMLLDSVMDALGDNKQHAEDQPGQVTSSHRLSGIRLLVVEDNLNNQQIARELLEDEGARVQIANHGQEAIDILQENPEQFDVVLMDLQMPVMDGLSATQYIRVTLGLTELPIIAMTANAMTSDRDACLAAGMNDHIGKPFDLNNLIRIIRQYGKQPELAVIADEDNSSVPLAQEWQEAASVAGIELEQAINRLGGDVSLYQQMVSLFAVELADFPQQADTLIAQSDWSGLSRLLHTTKGLAAQLGASRLSQLAGQGEVLVGSSPGAEELARFVVEAKEQIRTVQAGMAQLSQLLPGKGGDAGAAEQGNPQAIGAELTALLTLLQNSDMAALAAMDKLQAAFGLHHSEALAPLSHAVNQLDFALAIELAQALLVPRDKHDDDK